MNMITELDLIDVPIVGGRKPQCEKRWLKNWFLHAGLYQFSRNAIGVLEHDINDARVANGLRFKDGCYQALDNLKTHIQMWKDNQDGPLTTLTEMLMVACPTAKEALRAYNIRVRFLSLAWRRLLVLGTDLDTGSTQSVFYGASMKEWDQQMIITEAVMRQYIGARGVAADLGMELVEDKQVGNLEPDVDLDFVRTEEASAKETDRGLQVGDAADTVSGESPRA